MPLEISLAYNMHLSNLWIANHILIKILIKIFSSTANCFGILLLPQLCDDTFLCESYFKTTRFVIVFHSLIRYSVLIMKSYELAV